MFFFFSIKNEGTTLLLADIFATCYGREGIKEIRDTTLHGGPRIDPKFVNNPELSDVQFRVEGRVFYAHKIILITASPRFKSMLNSKFCEGNPPIIQINDIRYDIFQVTAVLFGNVARVCAAVSHHVLDGFVCLHSRWSCTTCTREGARTWTSTRTTCWN